MQEGEISPGQVARDVQDMYNGVRSGMEVRCGQSRRRRRAVESIWTRKKGSRWRYN